MRYARLDESAVEPMLPELADRTSFLTPEQALSEIVMLSVVRHFQHAPCILKGGSALAFTRGLNRPTTDLDFDLEEKADMKPLIRAGVPGLRPKA